MGCHLTLAYRAPLMGFGNDLEDIAFDCTQFIVFV